MRLMVTIVIYFAFVGGGFSQEAKTGDIVGSGATSCAEFAKAYRNDPIGAMGSYLSWAQGYMTAINFARLSLKSRTPNLGGQTRNLSAWSISEQSARLRMFCDQRPLASFFEAAQDLFEAMPFMPQSN